MPEPTQNIPGLVKGDEAGGSRTSNEEWSVVTSRRSLVMTRARIVSAGIFRRRLAFRYALEPGRGRAFRARAI